MGVRLIVFLCLIVNPIAALYILTWVYSNFRELPWYIGPPSLMGVSTGLFLVELGLWTWDHATETNNKN